jgi:hypothetical protein
MTEERELVLKCWGICGLKSHSGHQVNVYVHVIAAYGEHQVLFTELNDAQSLL